MHWVKSAVFSEDIDLSAIDKRLHQESIPHRFTFESGKQVLWLVDSVDQQQVVARVIEWLEHPDKIELSGISEAPKRRIKFQSKPAPFTLTLIFLSFVGASLVYFSLGLVRPFSFWDVYRPLGPDDSIYRDILTGEYWRLITPIFLHFHPLHVLFNSMWIWYLGSMIENASGAMRLGALVLFIALLSNIAQATASPYLFGGLSGINFGLLSYIWLGKKVGNNIDYYLSDAVFYFMTAYMVASALGLLEWLGEVEIADTAHIVGYISGAIAALIIYLGNSNKNDFG